MDKLGLETSDHFTLDMIGGLVEITLQSKDPSAAIGGRNAGKLLWYNETEPYTNSWSTSGGGSEVSFQLEHQEPHSFVTEEYVFIQIEYWPL